MVWQGRDGNLLCVGSYDCVLASNMEYRKQVAEYNINGNHGKRYALCCSAIFENFCRYDRKRQIKN